MQKGFPPVTLLILNYNGKRFLKECLDSVLKTDYPNFEVVVIDNASTDGSVEFIEKNYPQVRIIKNNRNYGFAVAYNLAIKTVKNEYLVLLNNDVIVEPDWLKKLISYISNGKVAAVNPKMLFADDRKRINAAGGNCDIYGVGWNRGNGEIDNGQYDKVEEVFYVNGAALLTKKSVWKDVGAFDERFFLYGEDLDWCWRARLKGYKILYVPDSKIYHHWRASGGAIIYFLERHSLATLLKNYELKTLIKIMPRYLALKFLKTIWLLKNGKEKIEKMAVLYSLKWNLINLNKTWNKRVLIQSSRKISDKEIKKQMFNGSFELFLALGKIKHPIFESLSANG